MVDVHTKSQRSFNMSRIKGRDTKPEIQLRKQLWRQGFRYTLRSKLPGRPDLVLPKYKTVIFIDGCFWHRCPTHFKAPASNVPFWDKKIQSNVDRDARNEAKLRDAGWRVLRFWEHEIDRELPNLVNKIVNTLKRKNP
jgi:DNA mismatch endonuclease (patch repair protein)